MIGPHSAGANHKAGEAVAIVAVLVEMGVTGKRQHNNLYKFLRVENCNNSIRYTHIIYTYTSFIFIQVNQTNANAPPVSAALLNMVRF